jgi:hypothetical protein
MVRAVTQSAEHYGWTYIDVGSIHKGKEGWDAVLNEITTSVITALATHFEDPANHADWLALASTVPMTQAEADARMEREDFCLECDEFTGSMLHKELELNGHEPLKLYRVRGAQ